MVSRLQTTGRKQDSFWYLIMPFCSSKRSRAVHVTQISAKGSKHAKQASVTWIPANASSLSICLGRRNREGNTIHNSIHQPYYCCHGCLHIELYCPSQIRFPVSNSHLHPYNPKVIFCAVPFSIKLTMDVPLIPPLLKPPQICSVCQCTFSKSDILHSAIAQCRPWVVLDVHLIRRLIWQYAH